MTQGQRALVLGATGQVGRATARALSADGWEVTAASRSGSRHDGWPPEVRAVAHDREAEGTLVELLGDGVELVADCAPLHCGHAEQLTRLADRIGSAVVVSTAGVYEDGNGRGLATRGQPDGSPRYPVPVGEAQPKVAPGEDNYLRQASRMERELLGAGGRLPVTVLRAGAVHGPHSRTPRELHFVKRWLDGRTVRLLADGGQSRFHTAHVANIAELVRLAGRAPGSRALNAADPEALTVAGIAEAMDAALGWECETVPMDLPPPTTEPMVGLTPWTLPHPLVLDMTAAERELGYRAVTGYRESLPETVEWLARRLRAQDGDWRMAFPEMAAAYDPMGDFFDYAAEDRWLERERR